MAKGKSKYKKYRGRVSYAMIYSPDEYLNKKFWKLNFHADEETFEKMRADGIQNKIKDKPVENCDGPFMTLKRDCEKEFSGDITKFSPPEVLDKDGKKLVYYEEDEDGDFERVGDPVLIGNGSEIEIELVIYPTKSFGKGSRLNRVRIIDLIEYNPDEEDEDKDEIPFKEQQEEKPAKRSKKVSW